MTTIVLPHICIDATCIVPSGKGATVYALSLLKALHDLNPPARFTVLIRQEAAKIFGNIGSSWSIQKVKVNSAHSWHLFSLPRLLQRLQPNLLHVLGEAALGWLPVPYILSVHELPHLYRQRVGSLSPSLYQYLSQRIVEIVLPSACRRASHVLALSQSTASDLIQEFKVSPKRVSVAYPAADARFFEATDHSISDWCRSLPRPYLLTFATGDRREIPEQVVQAFCAIAHQIPHYLVIAGRCPDLQKLSLIEEATSLGCLERLHFTGFVPDAELPVLYRDSDVYIEMSRYEGFGLQVCEAMATGTVAIASDVASLPEVVSTTDYLVKPDDSSTLANKLLSLLTDAPKCKRSSILASEQAKQFSWDKCAMTTWTKMNDILYNSN